MNLLYVIPAVLLLAVAWSLFRRYQKRREAERCRDWNIAYFNGRGL